MIGSLRGVVLDRSARTEQSGELLVEVSGVGYRVIVSKGALARAELGAPAFLHVHTHVREDAIVLYGFEARDERACFELLIGSHGIGPAVALALLSVHSPNALRRAVATDDVDALMLVPGIGRKTAVRLLVELKSRLEADLDESILALAGSPAAASLAGARGEVRAALAGLGYTPEEVRHALAHLPEAGETADLLRLALRELATAP